MLGTTSKVKSASTAKSDLLCPPPQHLPAGVQFPLHPNTDFPTPQMRRQATAEELLAQAEAKGYKRGAHAECDQVRDREQHG